MLFVIKTPFRILVIGVLGEFGVESPPRRGHASVDKVKPCNDSDIDVGDLPSVGSNSDVADANFS